MVPFLQNSAFFTEFGKKSRKKSRKKAKKKQKNHEKMGKITHF